MNVLSIVTTVTARAHPEGIGAPTLQDLLKTMTIVDHVDIHHVVMTTVVEALLATTMIDTAAPLLVGRHVLWMTMVAHHHATQMIPMMLADHPPPDVRMTSHI